MRPASFFVVRSPLIDGANTASPPELVREPIVREAIDRGSPSLLEALDGKRASRVDVWPSITRYLERMKGRCTPFSLMSGYAIGSTGGPATGVKLVARQDYRRIVRLDIDTVGRLVAQRAGATPTEPRWVAALGVSRFPDMLRVASRSGDGDEVRLTDVGRSGPLDQVLEEAATPLSYPELLASVMKFASDEEEAESFIKTLISERLIVPADAPPVLLVDELGALADLGDDAKRLASEGRRLRSTSLGEPAQLESLSSLEGSKAKDLIFDLVKPTETAALGDDVLAAIKQLIAVYPRMTPAPYADGRLADFRRKFSARFEGREVPLIEAVDPRRGFGFPLTADAPVPTANQDLDEWLMNLFERSCRTHSDIELRESDLLKPVRWTWPESFAVTFSLLRDPLSFWDFSTSGAPGTLLFARATAVLPDEFRQQVTSFLAEVARQDPNVDFADLAYFIPGRSASFTQYPLLQPMEITLTPTSNDLQRSLDANDLLVSMAANGVALRSAKTGRPVRIRTTGAANANRHDTTDLYRFLSAVAHEGGGTSSWSWGPARNASHRPRVSYQGHVLAPASWRLTPAQTEPLRKGKTREERWDAAQKLRAELKLPQHFRFHERHDHLLPVNLDDPYGVEAWLDIAQESMHLEESPPIERSAVVGPEGPYHHQVVVPMFGDAPKPAEAKSEPRAILPREVIFDRAIPGGSVLYLSFWGDADELLTILRELVDDVVRPLEAEGAITHWFYLPFSDPEPHMRLRLFGDPARLWSASTLNAFQEHLAPLAAQRAIESVSLDTYDRETYRYGGAAGVALAERVFHQSSEMALDLHEKFVFDVEGGKELDDIVVPLVTSHRVLLGATGLPLERQKAIAERAAVSYLRHADAAVPRRHGGELYRKLRDSLAASVAANEIGQGQVPALRDIFAEAQKVDMFTSFDGWFTDCLHVHSIRLLTTWHPIGHLETVGYHLLHKMLGTEVRFINPEARLRPSNRFATVETLAEEPARRRRLLGVHRLHGV